MIRAIQGCDLLRYFKWAVGLDYVLTKQEAVRLPFQYDKEDGVVLPESLVKKEYG